MFRLKSLLFCLFSLIVATVVSQEPQAIIDAFSKENNDAGVVVLIQKNNSVSAYVSGFSDLDKKEAVQKNDLFEIGSASKVFTAIAILQLIEDGTLSLDTTLDVFYPEGSIKKLANFEGKNYWDKVTVQMLLNHTSGFIDYLNVYESDEKALEIFNNSKIVYSFSDIIKFATDHGEANYMPGKEFAYTNTGYIILGDLITKVSKTPWRTYIENNIFKKAGLKNTYFSSSISEENKKRLLEGHYKNQITHLPPTLAGSAGEIISNLSDLHKFLIAWDQGTFYKNPETFQKQISVGEQQMSPGSDMLNYSLGVMKTSGLVGHGGQTFGFQSYISINPVTKDVYIIGINNANVSSFNLLFGLLR